MKKVAVSTYCVWTSYGSILQAYALKCALLGLGLESFIFIDEAESDPYELTKININNGLKEIVISIYKRLFRNKTLMKYKNTKVFINKYLDLIEYKDYKELQNNKPIADYYLSGSDQIFNPIKASPAFFLDFVEDKSKCYTYACSMGETKIPTDKEEIFSRLINNFKLISCREENNIPILRKYNPNAEYLNHIDPTFLLTTKEWETVMIPYTRVKQPYILVYPLYWDNNINEKLKTLHTKTGIDIVTICSGFSSVYANKRLLDVSVGEFLWLIQNAVGVVSSSFHGVALSLILNKKLSTIVNPKLPSRISCLMSKLCANPLEIENLISGEMNYEVINQNILKEKDKSITYLEKIFCE